MYHKVFSKSRYQTRSQNNFLVDNKLRRVTIGSRSESNDRIALIGKLIEHGKTSNLLDFDVYCDVGFPHVIGIFGSRGSGKSFDLGVFLEGIFLDENGETRPNGDAAVVFDIQDQFWTLGYQPSEDVKADARHISDLNQWDLSPNHVANLHILVPKSSDTSVPHAIDFAL